MGAAWSLLLLAAIATPALAVESICYGTVAHGRLEHGVPLPAAGKNFAAYSEAGVTLGRNYVHSRVYEVVIAAYQALEQSAPHKIYVYGETGLAEGGRLRPHRTHQNGLSVDFFVPVVDQQGQSVALPADALNQFGYGTEFDRNAQYQGYTIDFEAMAEHLYQLDLAAKARNTPVSQVIFERAYLPRLFNTRRGAYLRTQIAFM